MWCISESVIFIFFSRPFPGLVINDREYLWDTDDKCIFLTYQVSFSTLCLGGKGPQLLRSLYNFACVFLIKISWLNMDVQLTWGQGDKFTFKQHKISIDLIWKCNTLILYFSAAESQRNLGSWLSSALTPELLCCRFQSTTVAVSKSFPVAAQPYSSEKFCILLKL